jgi:hypothetical protein
MEKRQPSGAPMKLPEYDNRPAPGQPLYDSGDDGGDFKFPLILIGLLLGGIATLFLFFTLLAEIF